MEKETYGKGDRFIFYCTSAKVAAEKAFSEKGFEFKDKYIEKVWVADPVNPRKGDWIPKNE